MINIVNFLHTYNFAHKQKHKNVFLIKTVGLSMEKEKPFKAKLLKLSSNKDF